MDINRWSQGSDVFKTITSESETRNQTSSKKQPSKAKSFSAVGSPSRVYSVGQLKSSLKDLNKTRIAMLESKNYIGVAKVEKVISRLLLRVKNQEEKINRSIEQQEHMELLHKHQAEMARFQETWAEIFEKYERKEKVMKLKLEVKQEREIRDVSEKVKHEAERIDDKLGNGNPLCSKYWVGGNKRKDFEGLMAQNRIERKFSTKKELKEKRKEMVEGICKQEETKFRNKYNIKYNSLEQKLKSGREYELKVYKTNKDRLKQKFLNALSRLDHTQSVRRSQNSFQK